MLISMNIFLVTYFTLGLELEFARSNFVDMDRIMQLSGRRDKTKLHKIFAFEDAGISG